MKEKNLYLNISLFLHLCYFFDGVRNIFYFEFRNLYILAISSKHFSALFVSGTEVFESGVVGKAIVFSKTNRLKADRTGLVAYQGLLLQLINIAQRICSLYFRHFCDWTQEPVLCWIG